MKKLSSVVAATALSLLLASAAFAQTPAAAPKAEPKARSAASLECSKEADAKGLHGKERKKFRNECRKAAGDKK